MSTEIKLFACTKTDEAYFRGTKPKLVAFDTETLGTKLFPGQGGTVTHLSWAINADTGYVAEIGSVPETVLSWLGDSSVMKTAHNAAFDIKAVDMALGIKVEPCHDTMVLIHLADPASKSVIPRGLKPWGRSIGLPYWNAPLQRWQEDTLFRTQPRKKWPVDLAPWPPPVEILEPYSAWDSLVTFQLHQYLMGQLTGCERFSALLTMYSKLIPVFAHMEQNGMALDLELVEDIISTTDAILLTSRQAMLTHLGKGPWTDKFIGSPKQIGAWLMQHGIALPLTPKKNYSTKDDVLEALLTDRLTEGTAPHTVVKAIMDYRAAKKRQEKAADLLARQVNGLLPTGFDLTGARSGRTSSSPNTQNIERQGPLRSCFVSRWR